MDNIQLKPLDLLLAAKLAVLDDPGAPVRELEAELRVAKSSIQNSLCRLRSLGLVKEEDGVRRLNRLALRDLFEHAVRWIAPGRVGDFELGLPTAHASEVMRRRLRGDADPVVIPLRHGPERGRAINPIHPKAARAASRDPKLYKLLALVDVFRVDGARERQVAAEELRVCF